MLFSVLNVAVYLIVSLAYRRGMLDVVGSLRDGNLNKGNQWAMPPRVHVLAGCYSTPGYSFVHGAVSELHLIDCGVQHAANPANGQILWWRGMTQHHVFGSHPLEFVQFVYDGVVPSNATVAALLQ